MLDLVRCMQYGDVIGTKGGGGWCVCKSQEQCCIRIEKELEQKKRQEDK